MRVGQDECYSFDNVGNGDRDLCGQDSSGEQDIGKFAVGNGLAFK